MNIPFKSTYINKIESLSGNRMMIECSNHPDFGNDVIFADWPRDSNGERIVVDSEYVDKGHCLELKVKLKEFDIDHRGNMFLWLMDEDFTIYMQNYPESLTAV